LSRLLFLLWPVLFPTKEAVEHAADITANYSLHQVCAWPINSPADLKLDGTKTRLVDRMKIVANCPEKLAANSIVDREL